MMLSGKNISQDYGERGLSAVPRVRVGSERVAPGPRDWPGIRAAALRAALRALLTGPFPRHMDWRRSTGLHLAAALPGQLVPIVPSRRALGLESFASSSRPSVYMFAQQTVV